MSSSPTVEVVSKSLCPHCAAIKEWLASKGIPFTEIRHDDDEERQAFYDREELDGDERTVPQVFVEDGGQRYRIGGAKATMVSGVQSLFPRSGGITP